ncbi:PEP-CTERM sorting domain-containing protein [Stieleria sp. ICT_E10.1]|uniref:PEP-CTERM sorting domain-containing protein n=1 Tax=Stieleria sedimenti TaxID=2976331 RepID=UPI002180779B|nr:PEP-CTERM sorting domain-containing protein [Stieleria sedimenti]MCS7470919.1 PEP-CTERM sorting domain-containing protein [Stieleria sedimenti]
MKTFAFVTSLLFVLTQGASSHGALVSTILTLDAATPTVNTLDLSLSVTEMGMVIPLGASATELSGTMNAEIEIDFATGVISSLNLTGGTLIGSEWSMANVPTGNPNDPTETMTLVGAGTTATADTIPASSAVAGGNFNGTEHLIPLTGGTVAPVGVTLAGTDINGSGTGTLTATKNGDQYDLFFSMDIVDSETLAGGDLGITGTLVARGTVTAIPEPTAALALMAAIVVGVVVRRRRWCG